MLPVRCPAQTLKFLAVVLHSNILFLSFCKGIKYLTQVRVLLKNVTHHSSTTKNKTFVTVD